MFTGMTIDELMDMVERAESRIQAGPERPWAAEWQGVPPAYLVSIPAQQNTNLAGVA
jgi:hypothetical protein